MDRLKPIIYFFEDINVRKFCNTYGLSYKYMSFILTERNKLTKNYETKIITAILQWLDDKEIQGEDLCIKKTKKVKKSLAK